MGIDRFMSEARALTNFAGNAVATMIIGRWTGTLDHAQAQRVLTGHAPFDYATITDDPHEGPDEPNDDASGRNDRAAGTAAGADQPPR